MAELAYLYLQLTDIELVGIVDDRKTGSPFFEYLVEDLNRLDQEDWDAILLTRLDDVEVDMETLVNKGVNPDRITAL